jgi:hypothetical protein
VIATRDQWLWFVAGGFTGLMLARLLARWWRRLFWVAAAAAFGLGALLLANPSKSAPALLQSAQKAAWVATRALLTVAESK